jgi:hypothetical protein
MIVDPIIDRKKGFIFDRECDDKYVSVEVRISEDALNNFYDLADLFQRINRKSEWRAPTRIIEWALFVGTFDIIFECFQSMNDNGEITEEQWEQFLEKWESADYYTRHNPEMWG